MYQIIYEGMKIAGAMLLVLLTVIDIKTKRVPRIFLGIAIGSVCILCLFGGAEEIIRSVLGAVIGLMFVVFSYITKEAIGYGDSWLMVWLGMLLGGWKLCILLFIAFTSAAMIGTLEIIRQKSFGKNSRIAFVPYLLWGYIGVWFL